MPVTFRMINISKACCLVLLSALGILIAYIPILARPQDASQSPQIATAPVVNKPSADATEYVGSETCKTCHEDMPSKGFFKNFEDSPHFVTTLDDKKRPEWHGCESCHGPGKAHVDG